MLVPSSAGSSETNRPSNMKAHFSIWNVLNFSPIDTASHHTCIKSLASPRWEPRISQFPVVSCSVWRKRIRSFHTCGYYTAVNDAEILISTTARTGVLEIHNALIHFHCLQCTEDGGRWRIKGSYSALKIPKAALLWNPQRNRKRGRPKKTWRRSIIKEAGRSWNELRFLAADRQKWKGLIDSPCC